MKKFGVVLRGKIDHIAHLVYPNHQDLCSDSSNPMPSYWPAQIICKRKEDNLNIKIVQLVVYYEKMCHENNLRKNL